MAQDINQYLSPSACVNSDHAAVIEQSQAIVAGCDDELSRAVALYYFVRDQFYYNPYSAVIDVESLKASSVLDAGEGWCVSKAVLLAALCRAADIPARLGFADVVNHLSTERLRRKMTTDVFYFHGYCSIYINGKWVKSTPAFNLSLCEKFKLMPLEFDGLEDSLYHPFDLEGNRHMEYINERGEYLDVPLDDMLRVFKHHYPWVQEGNDKTSVDEWQNEVDVEVKLSS